MPTRTATVGFAIPPNRLGYDAAIHMDVKNTWPIESYEIPLVDLRPDLDGSVPVPEQLDTQGFAVLKHESTSLGPLLDSETWNQAYLDESSEMIKAALGATDVFVWNSVVRSADPEVNTPYSGNLFQEKAIKGLQFGITIRGTANGAHIDQDGPNSMRMCRGAAGDDVFDKYKRVQQVNLWRPIKGPVTSAPLTVCDVRTLEPECKSTHMGMFGTRLTVHHGPTQKWGYISRQMPDEPILIKIYDSDTSVAPYSPHTGCDVHGADGEATPRESIEVRAVAVYS